jgi:ATP/maltotriose-dependent transcriptional regulator MalT
VSVAEVRGHLRVLYAKFGVAEPSADLARAQLVQQAFAMGLVAGGG